MKKKTVVKILLDILMLAVTALMYSSHAMGMAFHEFGGLALIGVFLIHKGLNFQWIRRVTVRLFRVDGRTRVKWIVDALLLLGFLAVGVSGILISKVAFPGLATRGGPWKAVHYGSAALSLILVGVHLGLHLDFLKGVFARWVRLPRVVATLLMVSVMAFGVYGLATTSFVRWLSMPFTAGAGGGEGFGGRAENGLRGDRSGQFPSENQTVDGASTMDSANDQATGEGSSSDQSFDASAQSADENSDQSYDASAQSAAESSSSDQSFDASAQSADENSDQFYDASAQTAGDLASGTDTEAVAPGSGDDRFGGQGDGQGVKGLNRPSGRESAGSFTGALSTLAQFASIAFLFAALTGFLEAALRRKKRQAIA